MDGIKDAYQDVQPVTLRLTEQSVTARLHCSPAKGIETHLSAMVEAFLVEVFRCRLCQFTSSQKARISSHVTASHVTVRRSCHLSCLEREDQESLAVVMRSDEGSELRSSSPYDLHPSSKSAEDQMDMERMSFLLPMYGMLQNVSPPRCDVGLSSNSEGSLHVAQTCEVSTLFEEDRRGEDSEEENVFQLEDPEDGLSGPLSARVAEDQDEVTAQSAHLMTLGLCRISSAKCPPLPGAGQDMSDAVDDKQPLLTVAEMQKLPEDEGGGGLSCVLCRAEMPNQGLLDVHLKCHNGALSFRCPRCDWASAEWVDMERHWRAHGRKRSSKIHKCGICPRKFRRAESRDAHEKRHNRRARVQAQSGRVARYPLCLEWCRSERGLQTHQRCHSQGAFKCVYCEVTEKSWRKIQKHIRSQHTEDGDGPDQQMSYNIGTLKYDHETSTSFPECHRGVQWEAWDHGRKMRVKPKAAGRKKGDKDKREGDAHVKEMSGCLKVPKRKEFCCTLCDRTFSTKLTLRRHAGIHQGTKPFACPHCHYTTRLKASLVQHLRVHTGEKPYKCAQCSYASIDRSSLRRHSRTHTQEKPYCCQYCPYSSILSPSVRQGCESPPRVSGLPESRHRGRLDLTQMFGNDHLSQVHNILLLLYVPDIRRSNIFCLANTEMILCDSHVSRGSSLPVCCVQWR
ncbi:zinc finger protein 236 isoform X2 [Electrophorus electricus]|uniref:zinc finger protein 236 isoform X2 n=1 Tax=Electrophorus electricus TaxID=8005 RepID=UPI0015D0A41C|nr:zinc finger protein 236 isoform X2 [Electrophorus electricus]